MKSFPLCRDAIGFCGVVALLAACGGLREPQDGMPPPAGGAMPQILAPSTTTPYQVLHNFGDVPGDGKNPYAGLLDLQGTLYGTTAYGGGEGHLGTVYSVSTDGTEKVLHRFHGGATDGANPVAALIAVNGTMYGTTSAGGSAGLGTVFSVTTDGSETILYSFKGQPDGSTPQAPLIDVNGMLYGTTSEGGTSGSVCTRGCGTVFSITPSGSENLVYSFKGGSNGLQPVSGLLNVGGVLYGTTLSGGETITSGSDCSNSTDQFGCGTVFRVTTAGEQKVLHSFDTATDGAFPEGALIEVKGTLFGTTALGGADILGTVFTITTNGKERVLYSFGQGSDGLSRPLNLVDVHGTLYGTAYSGGTRSGGFGGIYGITTSGTLSTLHLFTGGLDGGNPFGALAYMNGRLYGTTVGGGTPRCRGSYLNCGTVFALTP